MIPVRDATYCLRTWGNEHARPLVMLHGTRDTSITFQFIVDALRRDWYVIAPDWRGHGGTESMNRGGWFHDYLADLEVILSSLFPTATVDLVGHSLGGNVASTYAGLRPGRVRHMIALDAFGIVSSTPDKFAAELASWLRHHGAGASRKTYASQAEMAQGLCRANPRLTSDRARFLAIHSSRAAQGGFAWLFDQRTRRSIPIFHSLAEWAACWQGIRAPSLWVTASDPLAGTVPADPASFEFVLEKIGRERVVRVADTGHNVQHDQPETVAAIIETFLTEGTIHAGCFHL